MVHRLKTINPYFSAVWLGSKTFEMRKNDRMFVEGDEIYLREYDAETDTYSGREIRGNITYVLRNFGELKDFVVFSFKVTQHIKIGPNANVRETVCLHVWDDGSHNVHKCIKCGQFNC